MAPPPQVVQWLKETYPKPYIDPEWLDACYTWIIEEYNLSPLIDVDKIMESVESQLLQSDLRDSMLPGTGLPANISELTNVTIRGPFLVEIVAITEIGHSAFTLQNTRQVRMDRADLAGLGPEVADEDEGPIPKYPRSMLRFELSDGATTLQAMEYRPLPEIQLGVTPLGYKLLLKNVFIRRGVACLEPKSVVLKGHQTEDREAMQDIDFARSLRMRLGQPEPNPEDEMPAPASPQAGPPPPPAHRLPLEMSPPPPPSHPPPSSNTTVVQSSYFSDQRAMTNFGPSAVLARERLLSPTQRPGIIYTIDDDDVDAIDDDDVDAKDDDYVDETFPDVRQGKGKERARGLVSAASSEFGSDSMSMDEEFMEQLDQVEMKALSQAPLPGPSSSSWRVGPRLRSRVLSGTSMDVITIDDDEDDKENVSLSARRTRRRTDRDLQAVGQEVIDVSDSD